MSIRIITDGQDPLTGSILDYLAARYDIPLAHIRGIQLHSTIGEAQRIVLDLLVQDDDGDLADDGSRPTGPAGQLQPPPRGHASHDGPSCALCESMTAYEQDTVMVPIIGQTRDEHPRSHASTTCVFELPTGPGPDSPTVPCGEVIRWHQEYADVSALPGAPHEIIPGMGYWVHVLDAPLGTATHPATPGA
jgi:hypothetical protein